MRFCPRLTALEVRENPATIAYFNTSVLTVFGDGMNNAITISADSAGNLVVTDGVTPIAIRTTFGTATKANLVNVSVHGRGGNDTIILDRTLNTRDANNALVAAPTATLAGGPGNDVLRPLTGGFQGGVIGNPIIGNTAMYGGDGNDFLDSGFGNDVMFGGAGNDALRWLPGTLIDTFEGGAGRDTSIIVGNGNNQGDAFVLNANPSAPGRVLFQRTNLIPFFVDIGSSEIVMMKTDSGDDSITVGDLTGTAVQWVVAYGGDGNDTLDASATGVRVQLYGENGDDTLFGGRNADIINGANGHDVLAGNGGYDVVNGGAGDDTIDDNRMDGMMDQLSGGSGADAFVRRLVAGPPMQFDEIILDWNMTQGDTAAILDLR
jgi:Ca2+-binding RTX toxin-like protein